MRRTRRIFRENNDCKDEYGKEISEIPVGLMRFGDGIQLYSQKALSSVQIDSEGVPFDNSVCRGKEGRQNQTIKRKGRCPSGAFTSSR